METNLYRRIGQQIRHARENLGISQEELAKGIDFSSSATISHFESGQRKISLVDLQKISEFLGCSLDYLLNSPISSTSTMQKFKLRASNLRPSARGDVFEFLDFVQNNGHDPLPISFDAKELKPELAANKLLDHVQIDGPAVSPVQVAKSLDIPVFEWDFPNEVSGIFVLENNKVSIGVNRNHPNVRQRFTVAHELGHFVYRKDDDMFLDFNETDIPSHVYDEPDQQVETKSNQFAANLLMPKEWVKKDFEKYGEAGLSKVARKYEVSEQAMWFRLLNIGLVKNAS